MRPDISFNQTKIGGPSVPAADSLVNARPTTRSRLTAAWLTAAGLLFCMSAVAECPKGDPRVRIISPAEGQQFAPGDTVKVTVRSTVALAASWVAVGVPGAGVLDGQGWDGSTYHAQFVIPSDYRQLGPVEITPDVMDVAQQPIEGICVTIIVRRTDAPQSLRPVNSGVEHLGLGGRTNIYVYGRYPGNIDANLTSSTVGTRYTSSDSKVVTVDAEGHVQATGLGTAIVTATNGRATVFVPFIVEDPRHPLPPQDLTAQVTFKKSPLRLDEEASASGKTPVYVQTITVTNVTPLPIVGPLYVAIIDMPEDVYAFVGMPPPQLYYRWLKPKNGLTIQPDESATLSLQFAFMRSPAEPAYRLGLVRTSGDPQTWVVHRVVTGPPSPGPLPGLAQVSNGPWRRVVNQCLAILGQGANNYAGTTISNNCPYPVQYAFCYSDGGGSPFDCKNPPRGEGRDSLEAGQSRPLPQYKGKGIDIIMCRDTEIPMFNDNGRTGCF